MLNDAAVSTTEGLDALRTAAGWMPLTETGWIAVTGGDRVRWLNGMVTNSVQALTPGEGAYSFLLNAQGRIQGDATVWCEADRLLLQTDREQAEPMGALLDRFIIMDDVELADETEAWHGVLVAGPTAAEVLAGLGLTVRASRLLKRTRMEWQGTEVFVISAYSPAVPRFEVWTAKRETAEAMASALRERAAQVGPESVALLRVLEATPHYGVDIRDKDLPQETAQTRALHFNKGCYLGQEIVERIRSRGQVHRTFAAFTLTGDAPQAGTELLAEGKPVGVLTTVADAPIDGERLALGYIRREAVERRLPLTFAAEGASGTAEVRAEASTAQPAS